MIETVVLIAVISTAWAFFSLFSQAKDKSSFKRVKKELKKGRVVYQRGTQNSSSISENPEERE